MPIQTKKTTRVRGAVFLSDNPLDGEKPSDTGLQFSPKRPFTPKLEKQKNINLTVESVLSLLFVAVVQTVFRFKTNTSCFPTIRAPNDDLLVSEKLLTGNLPMKHCVLFPRN